MALLFDDFSPRRAAAPAAARFHGGGGSHAGARARRQHRDLHAGSRHDVPAVAGGEPGRAHPAGRQRQLLREQRAANEVSLFSHVCQPSDHLHPIAQNLRAAGHWLPQLASLAAFQASPQQLGIRRVGTAVTETTPSEFVSAKLLHDLRRAPAAGRLLNRTTTRLERSRSSS